MVEGYATKCRPLAQIQSANRSLTDASCVRQQSVEDRLQFAGRRADDLEHLRSRCFALARFGELAGELVDICFLAAGSAVTATAGSLWRISAPQRLAALRLYCVAACFGAPSHCLPEGSGQASYRVK